MKSVIASLLLATSLPAPPPAAPARLQPRLRELATLVRSSAWPEAATLARELASALAAAAPLEVFDAQVLAAPAEGLGIYSPLPGGVVRGDELYLYAAVRNHGLRATAAGWELHLVSDLVVLDAGGAELARDTAFGESRIVARTPHRDTFVNIALRVTGLPPGAYRMRLVLHDRIGGKQGQAEVPFRIP